LSTQPLLLHIIVTSFSQDDAIEEKTQEGEEVDPNDPKAIIAKARCVVYTA